MLCIDRRQDFFYASRPHQPILILDRHPGGLFVPHESGACRDLFFRVPMGPRIRRQDLGSGAWQEFS